jgi:hypothetical protein
MLSIDVERTVGTPGAAGSVGVAGDGAIGADEEDELFEQADSAKARATTSAGKVDRNRSRARINALPSAPGLVLRGRASDVLGSRTFRPLADIELDTVTLTQICEPFAIDRALVKEILLSRLVLDEPKSLIDSYRSNISSHQLPPRSSAVSLSTQFRVSA